MMLGLRKPHRRCAPQETSTMCLAIPMQVLEVDGMDARCEARGIERRVSLFLLQHETIVPGDCVVVHVGYAIQKMSPEEARSTWELFDEMLAADEPAQGVGGA
jgi:hydrogenase expression/formation protein HypC